MEIGWFPLGLLFPCGFVSIGSLDSHVFPFEVSPYLAPVVNLFHLVLVGGVCPILTGAL